jgi:pimeloyl-ACP methyl ester carboxylesterase
MSTLPDIGQVRTTQIDGLDIRLARSGAAEGVPILLTSPWPESIYAFRDTLPAIKSLGPIICVDLPGFGRSESRPDVMAPEAMGGFVVRLADRLGITRMHAVGPDVGTLALLFAAVKSPGLFESLVMGSGQSNGTATVGKDSGLSLRKGSEKTLRLELGHPHAIGGVPRGAPVGSAEVSSGRMG